MKTNGFDMYYFYILTLGQLNYQGSQFQYVASSNCIILKQSALSSIPLEIIRKPVFI